MARKINKNKLRELFEAECSESVVGSESSFHQLSPYIGKIKSSIASFLIKNFTKKSEVIYDPFCGAGTIPLEGLLLGRNVIANDINVYGHTLTAAKLFPPDSLEDALKDIAIYSREVFEMKTKIDLRKIPIWVRQFYHPETLREIIAWSIILKKQKADFLFSCLLGILHHQRPGFLSFPSSHTVPYLRTKKFPRDVYPELYEYRSVKERLEQKVMRAFKKQPKINKDLMRSCSNNDARSVKLPLNSVDAIVTSPPYMRKLDYARDNRLRLWLLGTVYSPKLDRLISPKESDFISLMSSCLQSWKVVLKPYGKCILFVGDNYSAKYKMRLPELIEKIACDDLMGYKLIFKHVSIIPTKRRVRRTYEGNKFETILVFEKKG